MVWLVVGDGVLRPALEKPHRGSAGLAGNRIHLLGLKAPHEVASLLAASDLYALSSAYEGMPMALLEAQGCGLPVVSTPVGEVKRVVRPGVNGVLSAGHQPEAFAAALLQGLDGAPAWRGEPALDAIRPYHPATVLADAYDNYRALHERRVRLRDDAVVQLAMPSQMRPRREVLGVPVDALSRSTTRARLMAWARGGESRYACFCNVHSVVTAQRDEYHHLVLAAADLVAPDGAPVAWTLRRKGRPQQERVDGPGTMWRLCADAEAQGVKIGLYGSTQATLAALASRLQQRYPRLDIAYLWSPPFRALSADEDQAVCEAIAQAGVGLLFVGLGCPKQERWMAEHRGRIPAVMLGVGAAFEFHAGMAPRAPVWMREHGLEWLHRLAGNPRRLAGRYLVTNTMFVRSSASEALRAVLERVGGQPAQPARPVSAEPLDRPARSKPRPAGRSTRQAEALRPVRDAAASRSGPPSWVPSVLPANGPVTLTQSPSNTEVMMLDGGNDTVDPSAIDDLVARIDASLSPRSCRVIEFVASMRGEGTSTLAAAYAAANAAQLQRKVLLLVTSRRAAVGPGVLQALAAGEPVDRALQPREDGVYVAMVGSVGAGEPGWKLLRRPELWNRLRSQFDLVVLDMPPIEVSRAGLKVAVACDGVVVVVEAEKTAAPW